MEKVIYDKKVIGEIHSHYNLVGSGDQEITPEDYVRRLSKDVSATSIGYAGFKTRKYLHESLIFYILDTDANLRENSDVFSKSLTREVSSLVDRTVREAYRRLPSRGRTRIYIFPTFQSFVRDRMFGVNGLAPYRNVFHLYLHTTSNNKASFLRAVRNTTAHEYNHAARLQFQRSSTLLESLVSEGLAEHFRMQVVGGAVSPWAGASSYAEVKKVYKKIHPLLESGDRKVYHDVFFADKRYPLWTGYALGYQIVKSFLENQPEMKWKDIIKLPPKEIFRHSDF